MSDRDRCGALSNSTDRSMRKVMHIITGLGAGGAQQVLFRLIGATRNDFAHVLVSLVDASSDRPVVDAAGVHCLGVRSVAGALRAIGMIRELARRVQPDIIQGWMYHGNLFASISRLMIPRVPVVWNIRHSPEGKAHQTFATRLVAMSNAWLSRTPRAVIYNSARSLALHAARGVCSRDALVIENGFDTAYFTKNDELRKQWRASQGIPEQAVVFGHAARFHPIKNHVGTVKAFAGICAERRDVYLAMVGEGVNHASSLREVVKAHGCADRVLLLGNESNMPRFYNGIDVLVLSSWAEGMPNVVGEAMACGVPCIVTNVGDAASLVGDTGWVCPSPAENDIAETMRKALAVSADRRGMLGAHARTRITSEYSLDRMASRYVSLYSTLIRVDNPTNAVDAVS